jgi:hypothetical protein
MLQILHEGLKSLEHGKAKAELGQIVPRLALKRNQKGVSVALSFQHADPLGMLKVYRAVPRRNTNGTIFLFPLTFEISSRARSDYRRYRIPVSDYNGMY